MSLNVRYSSDEIRDSCLLPESIFRGQLLIYKRLAYLTISIGKQRLFTVCMLRKLKKFQKNRQINGDTVQRAPEPIQFPEFFSVFCNSSKTRQLKVTPIP